MHIIAIIKTKLKTLFIFTPLCLLYNYKNKNLYALNSENIPTRQTSDPINDISISGPRDAFVESNDKNVALIQKRIKSSKLSIEQYTIGDLTNTGVILMYIEDAVNTYSLNNIKDKLNKIKTESPDCKIGFLIHCQGRSVFLDEMNILDEYAASIGKLFPYFSGFSSMGEQVGNRHLNHSMVLVVV